MIITEEMYKDSLLKQCEAMDRVNNLLVENQHLKEINNYLVKKISELARDSITREKKLAKLEADVIRQLNEYDPNQISITDIIKTKGGRVCIFV